MTIGRRALTYSRLSRAIKIALLLGSTTGKERLHIFPKM